MPHIMYSGRLFASPTFGRGMSVYGKLSCSCAGSVLIPIPGAFEMTMRSDGCLVCDWDLDLGEVATCAMECAICGEREK